MEHDDDKKQVVLVEILREVRSLTGNLNSNSAALAEFQYETRTEIARLRGEIAVFMRAFPDGVEEHRSEHKALSVKREEHQQLRMHLKKGVGLWAAILSMAAVLSSVAVAVIAYLKKSLW